MGWQQDLGRSQPISSPSGEARLVPAVRTCRNPFCSHFLALCTPSGRGTSATGAKPCRAPCPQLLWHWGVPALLGGLHVEKQGWPPSLSSGFSWAESTQDGHQFHIALKELGKSQPEAFQQQAWLQLLTSLPAPCSVITQLNLFQSQLPHSSSPSLHCIPQGPGWDVLLHPISIRSHPREGTGGAGPLLPAWGMSGMCGHSSSPSAGAMNKAGSSVGPVGGTQPVPAPLAPVPAGQWAQGSGWELLSVSAGGFFPPPEPHPL